MIKAKGYIIYKNGGSINACYNTWHQSGKKKLETNKILNKYNSGQQLEKRDLVFMAGYNLSYSSNLHGLLADDFETKMLKDEGKETDEDFKKGDLTLGINREGYESCSPKENPKMIYHFKIQSD